MKFKSEESRQSHADNNKKIGKLYKERNKKKYYKEPKLCKACGKIISYSKRKNKFCNRSCSAAINNLGIVRNGSSKNQNCWCCGNAINKAAKKFCSKNCQTDYNYLIYINKWKLGLENGSSGQYGVSKRVRRYMFEKFNSSCQECSWSRTHPQTLLIPLSLHHVDGDCTNNDEDNLELLCLNCHVMTPNYGSRNKNCTRVDKRNRG